jgi:hypothetical protein
LGRKIMGNSCTPNLMEALKDPANLEKVPEKKTRSSPIKVLWAYAE